MLDLTAAAEVDGIKFDGVDLFLFAPHVNIDASDDDLKALADKVKAKGLTIGSVVAPVWPPTGGGPAMDEGEGRTKFLEQVKKGCRIARKLRELGVRPYGVVRIDSATRRRRLGGRPDREPGEDRRDLQAGRARSPATTARSSPPRGRSAGAGCTPGGRWSTSSNGSASPRPSASRPTWPTPCSTPWARTPPRTASCPTDFDWKDKADARRGPQDLDRRPSAPGRSTSTSPRTTPRSSARARTTTPAATAWPPTPTASSTSPTTPASGSATRTATSPRRSGTSAGTAACSPTP